MLLRLDVGHRKGKCRKLEKEVWYLCSVCSENSGPRYIWYQLVPDGFIIDSWILTSNSMFLTWFKYMCSSMLASDTVSSEVPSLPHPPLQPHTHMRFGIRKICSSRHQLHSGSHCIFTNLSTWDVSMQLSLPVAGQADLQHFRLSPRCKDKVLWW